MNKPTERFSKTVEDYTKYRPSYPHEVLQVLVEECGLTPEMLVADVGSGTGLFSKLLLDNGNVVYGIEPNLAMRDAGEQYLQTYPKFFSIDGTAEHTGLLAQSIDIITVATAFHWFDIDKTKKEFLRILKEPGWVLLIWNVRDVENSALVSEYEKLINHYGTDFKTTAAKTFDKTAVKEFFAPFEMKLQSFKNVQKLDWQGFKGRLLSSSYSLRTGDQGYNEMITELKSIFERYQQNNYIDFLYSTKMYFGRLK